MLNMNDVFDNTMLCDITNMKDKLLILNNAQWKEDVQNNIYSPNYAHKYYLTRLICRKLRQISYA